MLKALVIGTCLTVAALCHWRLLRREAPRRANRRACIIVNGVECHNIEEAEEYADELTRLGIARVVKWPGLETDEQQGAAKAGGEQ